MPVPADPTKEARVTLGAAQEALRATWSRKTSVDPEEWSVSNPAWGQCAVTALIMQDFFDGQLLRTEIRGISHYWNRLSTGEEVDLTIEQFGDGTRRGSAEERSREYVLSFPGTLARYELLGRRVRKWLEQHATSG